ncbi:hypothetical protein ABPG77_004452 [Micractinium sp. CCAP 211/92]
MWPPQIHHHSSCTHAGTQRGPAANHAGGAAELGPLHAALPVPSLPAMQDDLAVTFSPAPTPELRFRFRQVEGSQAGQVQQAVRHSVVFQVLSQTSPGKPGWAAAGAARGSVARGWGTLTATPAGMLRPRGWWAAVHASGQG